MEPEWTSHIEINCEIKMIIYEAGKQETRVQVCK